jgi:cytochrome c-type biogenesis protein CcmH/NrfF
MRIGAWRAAWLFGHRCENLPFASLNLMFLMASATPVTGVAFAYEGWATGMIEVEQQQDASSTVAELPRPTRMSQFEWRHPLDLHKFSFPCPVCGKRLQMDFRAIGKMGRCPVCQNRFHVLAVERVG